MPDTVTVDPGTDARKDPPSDAVVSGVVAPGGDGKVRATPPTRSEREQALLESLRAVIRDAGVTPPEEPPPPGWRVFVSLSLLAVDVSGLLLLAGSVSGNPLVVTITKVLPALFGSTLVASFSGRARSSLITFASHWATMLLALLLLPVALLFIYPYRLHVKVDPDARVSVDGGPAIEVSDAGFAAITLGRFDPHDVTVEWFYRKINAPRSDSYHLARSDLLRTLWWDVGRRDDTLALGVLPSATVGHGRDQTRFRVEGRFRQLLPSDSARQVRVVTRRPDGTRVIEYRLNAIIGAEQLQLPEGGPWKVRVYSRTHDCWTAPDTITISRDDFPARDFTSSPCEHPTRANDR